MREIIEVFEKAAASYDEWYRSPIGIYALHSELKGLEAFLPPLGVGIDVGAGTGIFAKHLSTGGRCVVCLDPSPGMLKEAEKRHLSAIMAAAEVSPIRHGSLDFAYMVTVIEFLADPIQALRSVGAVLKEEAPLVILTINRESSWGEHYSKLAEKGDPIFSRANLYALGDVCSFLDKAGFELEKSMGTLTASPNEPEGGYELVPVSPDVGVILIKAKKLTSSI